MTLRTREQLRALYAQPGERALHKQLPALDPHATRFIAHAPFCVLASAGMASDGTAGALLDASPRGGAPGFVKVVDAHTLWLPDAGGNNRLDTLENLLDDPRCGLLFMIPGMDETLRVNGLATLRDDAAACEAFAHERQRPKLVIEVAVREVYLHCAKAFMRSQLWQPDSWPPRSVMPTLNAMITDQIGASAAGPESEAAMRARYREQLEREATPDAARGAAH
ncbi:phosphohydrolase [Comamonas serinivorans]|uniref:Phosphohydrolase n=1 Tax=Comamonas serinivorans TaxID=1082851 RepID=A0A1Y0ESN1_9BURK|nr:pyridoxamine 5'-phosphate oxidase family protein [Comamonas serinivorans]ARU06420.1 phosphohydrolase [Comamonas serinivorans]